ncbi:VWA domain-containing protein [Actinoplanes sp. TBRC 11911]|uniref:VWA domain-containing protein n=1 Tax=Actinoplanes sp. TBRC 11911 TaxID=2729386 RepID=UPI00145DBBA3|nr:VWA domain-containing protein [Actinoplanes sp. TBRC 11911]NMO55365.1 VWA domain-containing protein [Actinoplanes sp. TBRC 11911]
MIDPDLERWRLVLGEPASVVGDLSAEGTSCDAALDWLYGRDVEHDDRDVRQGGLGASVLTTVDWLHDINRLFPRETIERLHRDAVERYEITDIVTDPAVLEAIEPSPALLRAVLQTKHLMNPDVLRQGRRIVEAVVRDLMATMTTQIRSAFTGTRARRPSRQKQARDFDVTRTLRANLGHYRPGERRLYIETPHFFSRTRKQVEQWQVILLVDQSGSMVDSVIHAAVTAACLWALPGVRTHLVAFDTEVVDLTSDVDDPVELLMSVQLGGGTDIGRAVRYSISLIERPRRAIVVLISDFFEGGSTPVLVRAVRELLDQGTKVLGLAALDTQATPTYDRDTAQRLADVGAAIGAMTPGELAAFIAQQVGR